MAESNKPNEIDCITREYLRSLAVKDAKSSRAVQTFSREARSGWQMLALEAALSNFHARWLGAREVICG